MEDQMKRILDWIFGRPRLLPKQPGGWAFGKKG